MHSTITMNHGHRSQQRSKENISMNIFSSTFDNISNLDLKFSSFTKNVGKEVQDIRSITASSGKHNRKVVRKENILEASAFLQNQQNKLIQIESSLPPLVDMLLGNTNTANVDVVQQQDRMNMTELASACRHLHALQAKQLLHLESTLVADYGYITASQREEEEEETNGFIRDFEEMDGDEYKDSSKDMHVGLESGEMSNGDQPVTPTWMKNHMPSDHFQPTPSLLDQRLPRLSEATLETDGGTPGSVFTIDRTMSPNDVNVNGNGNGNGNGSSGNRRASMMSLKSLAEEESENEIEGENNLCEGVNDAGLTYDSESDGNLSYDSDNEKSVTQTTTPDQECDEVVEGGGVSTPKTPSVADMKLSMTTMTLLEVEDKSTSDSQTTSVDTTANTKEVDDSVHQEVDNMESDEESSIYDSCEESFDSTLDEASLSMTSTVVQQPSYERLLDNLGLDRTVIPDVIISEESGDVEFQNAKREDAVDDDNISQQENTNDSNHQEFSDTSNFNDTQDCSLTRITLRSNAGSSVHDIQMQDDSIANFDKDGDSVESEETGSSSNETDPSNSSRDTRYSTIDTSVYHHPSVQELNEAHVDTSILLESETPRNRQGIGSVTTQQGFHPSEDVVTSPLDRFQVQVLNGGSYCKVTPIGNTMFSSMQSPIMKAQSPKTTAGKERASANVSSLESSGTSNTIEIQDAIHCDDLVASVVESPQLDRRGNKANQKMPNSEIIEDDEYKSEPTVNSVNESTHSESTESFYSSNTSESDDSNPTCSNTGDVTEYSASAFLPNIEKPIIEYIASNIGNNNVDDNEDKKLTPSCNISPAETPIDGTRSHAKRTPGGTLLSTIMSRTPRAAAFIEKHMADEKDRLLQVLSNGIQSESSSNVPSGPQTNPTYTNNNLASDFASESKPSQAPSPILPNSEQQQLLEQLGLEDDSKLITPLTPEEFDASPPIIKKLVTREDINRGIVLINNWLVTLEGDSPPSLPEDSALEILGEAFNASQVKRIFLSLCSLQRIMISRKTNGTTGESVMHYVIL